MINAKVGDTVVRNLCGTRMELIVTAVTDKLIICGGDEKDRGGDIAGHIERPRLELAAAVSTGAANLNGASMLLDIDAELFQR